MAKGKDTNEDWQAWWDNMVGNKPKKTIKGTRGKTTITHTVGSRLPTKATSRKKK
jgi:UDP-N-acetylmuramoylalanine-D-glutamate ligase